MYFTKVETFDFVIIWIIRVSSLYLEIISNLVLLRFSMIGINFWLIFCFIVGNLLIFCSPLIFVSVSTESLKKKLTELSHEHKPSTDGCHSSQMIDKLPKSILSSKWIFPSISSS
jgi:hypothetical protein